jgi:hypothetical protein
MLFIVGAFVVWIAGATLLSPQLVWSEQSCRGRRTWANGQSGFPRNLGDPVVSTATSRAEIPGKQLLAPRPHGVYGGSERAVQPWYRQAKETKRDGMDGRKS